MVEIFKTNVTDCFVAQCLIDDVKAMYHDAEVSFDLEDCDRIFRFFHSYNDIDDVRQNINQIFQSKGYSAIPLEDEPLQIKVEPFCLTAEYKVGINAFLGFI